LATAIAPAADGAILLATRLEGILKWDGSHLETLAPKSALPASPIVAIAASEHGDVWLGTVDAGVLRLRSGVITALTAGLPDLRINSLLSRDRDEVYAGTNRGLARWDGTQFTQARIPAALRQARILAMAGDRDANLWEPRTACVV
jgi:ligand-binding sensor domain-containing protein